MFNKKLGIALCIVVMQTSLVCALQQTSDMLLNWDERIDKASELKNAMTKARTKDKKAAETTLQDYCHDKIGFHGRMLRSYLTQEQKAQAFEACGKVLENKDPQAYAALKEAQGTAVTRKSGTLGKKSEQLQTEAADFQSSAAALKAKMKAEAEKPWYKF